jgi:aspartyl-tRNA(Asn)/glutamyl-tRNA(Gln) amidotransferase subunit B
MTKKWETIIGLEVHVQLSTASKLFSGAATAYGRAPNSQACIIDLGLPGVLPVLNAEAVAMAVKLGLSINAAVNKKSIFARKNYYYPDLPKGYQISQHDRPIVGSGGYIDITIKDDADGSTSENSNSNSTATKTKRINITRAHLEEDSGKLLHEDFHGMSGVDFNRAGIPLIEIVSEPDMRSPQEAVAYLKTLHSLVRYLEICDGNMQEGSLRCDVNVSVRHVGDALLGTRTELKNLNSFRFVERAIEFEAARQIAVLESGGKIIQETRLYDDAINETRALREKEEALDYRYFPDPDLLPLVIEDTYIEKIRHTLPELPWQKHARFQKEYGLSAYDAAILSSTKEMAAFFEATLKATAAPAKLTANWIIVELLGALNRTNSEIGQSPIAPKQFAALLNRIHDNTISGKIAKEIFGDMLSGAGEADTIIEKKGLRQITDSAALEALVDKVLQENAAYVAQYKAGKVQLFGFLVGQAMKASKGKANPQQINELLKTKLEK